MAIRRIMICGEPVLKRKSARVTEVDEQVRALLDDMVETMMQAPGLGLAAPQVGESARCIVVRNRADTEEEVIHRIVNPRLRARYGEQTAYEGCLSLPTLQGEVARPYRMVVSGIGPEGEEVKIEAEGLLARVLMHEMDHLDGMLLNDRAVPGTLGWMVPDESEEEGYRIEPASPDEILAAYERLRQRQAAEQGET